MGEKKNKDRPICGCRSGDDCKDLATDNMHCSREFGKCDCQFVRSIPSDGSEGLRDGKGIT